MCFGSLGRWLVQSIRENERTSEQGIEALEMKQQTHNMINDTENKWIKLKRGSHTATRILLHTSTITFTFTQPEITRRLDVDCNLHAANSAWRMFCVQRCIYEYSKYIRHAMWRRLFLYETTLIAIRNETFVRRKKKSIKRVAPYIVVERRR